MKIGLIQIYKTRQIKFTTKVHLFYRRMLSVLRKLIESFNGHTGEPL